MDSSAKLISLVKIRPDIYKYRSKTEKTKSNLRRLWKEIASEMKLSEQECKRKWVVLRNCYARILRDERCQVKKKKTWYLENDLSFLKKYIRPHNKSMKLTEQSKQSSQSIEAESNCSFPTVDKLLTNETSNCSVPSIKSSPISFTAIIDEAHPTKRQFDYGLHDNLTYLRDILINDGSNSSTISIKASQNSSSDRKNEPIIEVEVTPSQNPSQISDNSNYLFLTSLLPDLNKLSEKRQRVFKRKTIELLEILFDDPEYATSKDNTYGAYYPTPISNAVATWPTFRFPAYNYLQPAECTQNVERMAP